MADLSVKLPKPKYGQVVVLQKNGDEPRGHGFPLISTSCVVGRSTAADIRISSADVSLTHCIFKIDEASGEASLEVHGNETQVNGTVVDPVNTIKLNHKDVILIGGRKLRFEYLPPDYKPLPSKPISGVSSDSFNAEVVDIEENGDVADCNTEKEEEVLPEVLSTPATKRVSFGPYLSPEQFDKSLPPATPIKKGSTPRRSTRYSGLKFTRSVIDPLVEEDATIESPSKEEPAIHNKECIDETIISEDADVSSLAPSSETAIVDSSPSLGIGAEFPELSNPSNLEMSVDAMSTLSDVSNIAAVPSECCSFLDEPIEEDEFGPEVVEQEEESLTQMEDTSLFSEDLIGVEIPVSAMTTSRLTNGTELLRSFTTSSLTENMGDEEEGITLSPEDMSSVKNGSIIDSTAALEVQETPVPVKTKEAQSPQVDVGEAQHLVETEKLIPVTPVDDIKLPEAVDFEDVANIVETSAAVVVERVEQIDIININAAGEKAMETPESSPAKTPIQSPVSDTPKADDVISKAVDTLTESPKLEGVARLLETPKSTRTTVSSVGKTPQADYTDVRGVKKLLQTPKPPPNTPKADYRDVRGVKRLLATPKAAPSTPVADYTDVEGVDLLMKTPKDVVPQTSEEIKISEPEKMAETEESKPVPETTKEIIGDEKDMEETPSEDKAVEKLASDVKERNETIEIVSESKSDEKLQEKSEVEEESATASKRGRRAVPIKTDYVSGVKRTLRIPRVPGTPKADYTNVEGIDLLMKTPKPKEIPSQIIEEEKHETLSEQAADNVVMESTSETPLKSVESIKETKEDASVNEEKNEEVIPKIDEQETKETEVPLPRRGRRAAAANTPKADYRDVSGVKRLLKTPKAAPGTPKADYCDVEGVALLMKTPKDPLPQKDVDVAEGLTEDVVEEVPLQSGETIVETINADVVDESKATTDEQEKEAPLPRRGRRVAAAKTPNTPKADYRDVSGVKRLLKTPKAAPDTPKADYSDVEGVDLLMKTPKDPVSQTIEEEKHETVSESTAEASQESAETKEKVVNTISESSEESTVVDQQTNQVEETEIEKETTPPRRGRRLAKTNTPKADYRDVGGMKRLLKTPKAAPATPKADYSDVDGIDLLMKTPKVSEECVEAVTEESTTESSVEAIETIVNKEDVVAAQVEEQQPTQVEGTEEVDAKKQVAPPRRGRKPAAAKTNTSKADDKDAKEVQQPSKTLTAADVKDADVLTSEQEKVEEVPVPEGSPEDPVEEATPAVEANEKSNEDETKREEVAEPQSNVEQDPEEVEKEATPPRRGRRAVPKSNTPKPTGRTKRKQPSSDSDSQPESNGTVPSGSEKEEQVVEEKAKPLAKISTPKRSRRTPSIKVETPKAVRSMRGKRPSESDSTQSEEVESRPLRSKRRIEEQLTLSPVVRLQRIDVDPTTTAKVARKRASVSSGEEWGVPEEVKPVRRARGRPPKVAKSKTVEEYTATHKADESISSEDDEVTKKTTRRGAVKRVPEAPEGKRRRGEAKVSKPVAAGLDDVEMLHEGKGHAADIHANHVPDEADGSPVTSVKSGRPTRAKGSLKVHFDVAETVNSPVRSTRSAKKVSVQLERDPDIETLAATAKEEEEKAPAAKRSRQKKGPAESPAVPATKRTRGGKKTTSEPELVKEDTSPPPPPRRTRRTRNI
ncbi:proliferation marker protein Ki-67-like [Daphnia carinata]|uniref:proliferation marker protein Ki-67-like n=1 Tax=Daphnia carinata TaxID=120202 RepID=UPI002868C976|nr:proliferation marker protein Ki-67-like [Daphnia carinata]